MPIWPQLLDVESSLSSSSHKHFTLIDSCRYGNSGPAPTALLFLIAVELLPRASTISLVCAQPHVWRTATQDCRHRQKASEACRDIGASSHSLNVVTRRCSCGRLRQRSIRIIASISYRQQAYRLKLARPVPHRPKKERVTKSWTIHIIVL